MRNFITLILIIFLPVIVFAQAKEHSLSGLWVKVKAEKKDGSRIVDHRGCGMDFIKYDFSNDGFVNMGSDVLFDGFKTQYAINGDTMRIGATNYNLLSLTKDTLKLSFFVPGADDGQLPVYYFVKAMAHDSHSAATFNAALKDSVYQADNKLFPVCKGNIGNLMGAIATRYDRGTLKVSFIIDKKGRLKNYTILEKDSVSTSFAKIVGNAFDDLSWLPARKNNEPVNSIVQVTLKSGHKAITGSSAMNTLQIEYPFLPVITYGKSLTDEEIQVGQQYFRQAIAEVNSYNYKKAMQLLNECIDIDDVDINAYSLRAIVNLQMGNKPEACKDWTTLAGLGQVPAVKNLAKFCAN